MEAAVGKLLLERGLRLGVAESLTGGLLASRLVAVPGASSWFQGGVVAYQSSLKQEILKLGRGPVVSLEAASAMAEGALEVLRCDVALSTTGVAGPDEQEGNKPGTVFVGIAMPGSPSEALELHLPGDRERVRQMTVISALSALRSRLVARHGAGVGESGLGGPAHRP